MSDRTETVLDSIDDVVDEWDDWNGYSADAATWTPPELEDEPLPTRVRWCPEVANPAAPTAAELDAGTDLTGHIAAGSSTYEPRRTVTYRMSLDTRRLVESVGRAAESMRQLEAALDRIPAEARERNAFLAMTGDAVAQFRRYYPEPREPVSGEEFRRRALDARRNRNTGPQRPDNRRWRTT